MNATQDVMSVRQARRRGGALGGLLDSVQNARHLHSHPHPDELVERECARNALTWAALTRLGIKEGAELALDFFYETAGGDADRTLATYLRLELGYDVVIESDGVTGRTPPLSIGPAALDEWVETMMHMGYEHGGCAFSGWTATVTRPASSPA